MSSNTLGSLCLAFLLGGSPALSQAGHIETIDCNVDAYNLTGADANDYEVRLAGIALGDVLNTYSHSGQPNYYYFPNLSIAEDNGDVLMRFSGTTVPDGGRIHIGYEVGRNFPNQVDAYWSLDGARLGGVSWRCGPLPSSPNIATVTNSENFDAWVSRRTTFTPQQVELEDLLRDGALWNVASAIDPTPSLLPAGGSLTHSAPHRGSGSYVLMYDFCSDTDCNSVVYTMLQSIFYVPEPGALSLFALGIGALGFSVARSRRQLVR